MTTKARLILDTKDDSKVLTTELTYISMDGRVLHNMVSAFEDQGHFPTHIYMSHRAWRLLVLDPNTYFPNLTNPCGDDGVGDIWGIEAKLNWSLAPGAVEMLDINDKGFVEFRVIAVPAPIEV